MIAQGNARSTLRPAEFSQISTLSEDRSNPLPESVLFTVMTYIKPFHLMCVLRAPNPHFAIHCDMSHRCIARWPDEFPTVSLGQGRWSCYEHPDGKVRLAKFHARIPKLYARIKRYMEFVEDRNLKLAKANPDSLLELGQGCLKWHECLPPGVTKVMAARLTGVAIHDDWWVGQTRCYASYLP